MCAWVALNIVIFGLIDLAKKNVSSTIPEVSCRRNSVVSRFFVQNSAYIFQLQNWWIVEGRCMVFSCFSSRMFSEKQMTTELLILEPVKMWNSYKILFYKLELFWEVSHSKRWPIDHGELCVELKASNAKKVIFIILTYCGGQNDKRKNSQKYFVLAIPGYTINSCGV